MGIRPYQTLIHIVKYLRLIILCWFSITTTNHAAVTTDCDGYRVSAQFPQYTQNQHNFATVDYIQAITSCLREYNESKNQVAALNLALLYYGSYDFKRSVFYLLKTNISTSKDAIFLKAILQPTSHYARATSESKVSSLITLSIDGLASNAVSGYETAQFSYAYYILASQQYGKEVQNAIEMLESLASVGITEAMNALGAYYSRSGRDSDAARVLKDSARRGDVNGQRLYAALLMSLNKDFSHASQWYEKAAQQGDLVSKYNLLMYKQIKNKDQFESDEYRALLALIESKTRGRIAPPYPAKEVQSEEYYELVRKRRAIDYLDLHQVGSPLFAVDEKQQSIETARERLMLALLIEANEMRKMQNSTEFPNNTEQYVRELRFSQNVAISRAARDIEEERWQAVSTNINRIMDQKCRRDPTVRSCYRNGSGQDVLKAITIGVSVLAALVSASSVNSKERKTSSSWTPPHVFNENPGIDMAIIGIALQ